ncbi:MAG: PAS domain-containing protein [Nitrospinae bacterium]|nr:PAS domain-containing protein [Nitrospinota bacterium]
MKKIHLSLLQKTFLAVIAVFLPLIVAFVYNYNINRKILMGHALEDLSSQAFVYEEVVSQFLEKSMNRVQDFSSDGVIRNGTQSILEGQQSAVKNLSDYILKNKLIIDKSIHTISIISPDGRVLTSTDPSAVGSDLSGEEFFKEGKDMVSIAEKRIAAPELPEIVASAPLLNISTGRPIGVIANFIRISELNSILERIETEEYEGEKRITEVELKRHLIKIYLVNREKRLISKPSIVKDIELNHIINILPVKKALESNEEFSGFYDNYRKIRVAGASEYLPEMKWVLIMEEDIDDIIAHTWIIGRNMMITASIVIGIIIVMFIIFFKNVVIRIKRVSAAAEDIARGRYEIAIPIQEEDEIGILSRSFNRMASEINRRTNELEESGKKLKEAQHIARLGNWEWDIVKDKLYWSDEIYNIFGVELDKFEDSRFLKFVHPDDREFVKNAVNDALDNKKPYSIDYRIVLKGGGEKFIHEQGVVALNSTGEPVRMAGTIQDITERKILEKSQLELQQRYEELINSLNAGVFKIDTDGKMIEVNKACVMMAEADSREEFLKHNVLDLLENKGKLKEIIDKLLKGESVVDEEIPFITIKGNKIWTSVSTVLKKGDNGNIYLEGIIEEITEKKRLEDQLRHSQKMESVGILAGGLAHDFNNILSAIMNYGNLLIMKKGGDETTKKFAEQIILASEKGANLTRGILAFSRKQVMNLQVMDLNELVQKIEKILLRLIGEDIELKVNLTDKTLTVNIDEIQIDQILMNLATNARDAMQKGGTITISTDIAQIDSEFIREFGYGELGKYALISFSDNGVGMDEGTRKKIFEPFFTTKGVGKGTGLGLSMSYGIVKQHNGYINVFSEPNKGTEFKIYLPLSGQSVSIRKTVKVSTPIRGSETVLLAEDNSLVRETAKAILEEYGYKVIEAVDGEDAVQKFVKNKDRIKLIISDMIMPKMSGKEAYEEIKKISPGMKILFISGYAPDLLKVKALHEDGMNFISKPVVPDNLLRKVREVIDSKD